MLSDEPVGTDEPSRLGHAMASFAAIPNSNQEHSIKETILNSNYFLNFEWMLRLGISILPLIPLF